MKPWMLTLLLVACQTTQAAESLPPAADMPRIAREAIASYKDENRKRYLNTLFRLKMVAQDYIGASVTLDELRQSMAQTDPQGGPLAFVQYETYIVAKQLQSSNGIPFDSAYSQAFREVFAKLDDAAALRVAPTFVYDLERARKDLQALAAKGWHITGFMRTAKPSTTYHEIIEGDAKNAVQVVAACAGQNLIIYGVNPPYPKWANDALPMLKNATYFSEIQSYHDKYRAYEYRPVDEIFQELLE